ncbi:unknown [Sinorhizobium phage PBC5]|uniref:hypothetical protein n=1 Tax=Sinorhizobium phage PBC5 TaxID=179237 RepID=UPI000009BA96|nr:hypothetical protein PBC5_gp48 [Sinorhizobium phage PBC5]AAL49608.1 unknown [Sinorhizobium phage PBC5]
MAHNQITQLLKQRWHAASTRVDLLDAERMKLLEPTEKGWHAALDELQIVNDQIEAHEHLRCDGCEAPIFDGDPRLGGNSMLCEDCSPTVQALLEEPEFFVDGDGNAATPEQCQEWFNAHIAAGGSPSDSMARW